MSFGKFRFVPKQGFCGRNGDRVPNVGVMGRFEMEAAIA